VSVAAWVGACLEEDGAPPVSRGASSETHSPRAPAPRAQLRLPLLPSPLPLSLSNTAKADRLKEARAEADREIAAFKAIREEAYQRALAEVRRRRGERGGEEVERGRESVCVCERGHGRAGHRRGVRGGVGRTSAVTAP